MKNSASIGIYGLGVMGRNLARNLAMHGFTVSVYSKDASYTRRFCEREDLPEKILPFYDVGDFLNSLTLPRRVLVMVTAGAAVDSVIGELLPMLCAEDILMDGGNSHYEDTARREAALAERGICFLGIGVSGGAQGALTGPSLMPGGDVQAYEAVEPMLTAIAAKSPFGGPCCAYTGAGGAGHFIKTVHNGIEYAVMQLICEAYHMMRTCMRMSAEECAEVFAAWNAGRLRGYLVEITAKILRVKEKEGALIDRIEDAAAQKGTGKWTVEEALRLGIPAPTIAEAVSARDLSAKKELRRAMEKKIVPEFPAQGPEEEWLAELESAVYCSVLCCYAQGFALIDEASRRNGWMIDPAQIALLWSAGCIIRADILGEIREAFLSGADGQNLPAAFSDVFAREHMPWRRSISRAVLSGCALPCMQSAVSYFDGLRCGRSPVNLLQAQRDFFGAHTYRRTDMPGDFHTVWE